MTSLSVHQIGIGVALQDMGRSGFLENGLTRGGACDLRAIYEGAALLMQSHNFAALEMTGTGGTFEAIGSLRIALTGALMNASIDDEAISWNASHYVPSGARLVIGPSCDGTYGYLHVGGGFQTDVVLGSCATHQSVGLGTPISKGQTLQIGTDLGCEVKMSLPRDPRFSGGDVRIVPSMQTNDFDPAIRARFAKTKFRRDPRTNRQGVRLDSDGKNFSNPKQLSIVSEVIVPGDIQITGDGTPFVLMAECQTTGGYPRIGTVLPCDLPLVAQAPVGAALQFKYISLEEGSLLQARADAELTTLKQLVSPLIRDPDNIKDLLSYQLVGGVISATASPFEEG